MKFDYENEKKVFEEEWSRMKELMLAEGMNEKDVTSLYFEDWEKFKKDRQFVRHKSYKKLETLEQPSSDDLDGCFHLFEFTLNEQLFDALCHLTEYEKQIVHLRYEKDLQLSEMAALLGKNHDSIRQAHSRVIKKIKKFLNDVTF